MIEGDFRSGNSMSCAFANAPDVDYIDFLEVAVEPSGSSTPSEGYWNLFSISVLKCGAREHVNTFNQDVIRSRYATFYRDKCAARAPHAFRASLLCSTQISPLPW
jgi:hypothetical protein